MTQKSTTSLQAANMLVERCFLDFWQLCFFSPVVNSLLSTGDHPLKPPHGHGENTIRYPRSMQTLLKMTAVHEAAHASSPDTWDVVEIHRKMVT